MSLFNHIIDIHDGHGKLYKKCPHEKIERDWLEKGKFDRQNQLSLFTPILSHVINPLIKHILNSVIYFCVMQSCVVSAEVTKYTNFPILWSHDLKWIR